MGRLNGSAAFHGGEMAHLHDFERRHGRRRYYRNGLIAKWQGNTTLRKILTLAGSATVSSP
ncbi:MAG: hypothetical protein AB9873_17125 [Syntrophobacteraceae bacterium]